MFRVDYTDLGYEQVKAAVGSAPAPAGGGCARLSGRTMKIVLDDEGTTPPRLEYEFLSPDELLLKENGGSPVKCRYGALSLKNVTLFSHMLPGTLRGYSAAVNLETGVVTVEEMWFLDGDVEKPDSSKKAYTFDELAAIGPYVNREVQRQFYRGYFVREDAPAPQRRDQRSLRLDNKMILWKDTLGREQVVTYTTSLFSTVVELNTPDGEDVVTVPSDYYQSDDSVFIYSRGEVEYSGRLDLEVMDLFTMKKIGVTVGIDENDRFVYSFYKADGRCLGQYATFYDFNDRGNRLPPSLEERMRARSKGARCTYRTSVLSKRLTEEDVRELSRREVPLFVEGDGNTMLNEQKMADSKQCSGKKLRLVFDTGLRMDLDFISDTRLRFRKDGEEWEEEEYRASQLDEDLVYLGYYREGSCPPECFMIALDFSNGCATCIDSVMEGGADVHDMVPAYHFGYIQAEGVPAPRTRRHGFTRELLGRSFTWTYSDGISSQHIYNAPEAYSWTIFTNGEPGSPANRAGGFVWSSPCTYIKLREDVFIMTWVEEKWAGTLGSAAMNLRLMHDCGFILHIEHDGGSIGFDQMSALARDAGRCDLSGVYELKFLDTEKSL